MARLQLFHLGAQILLCVPVQSSENCFPHFHNQCDALLQSWVLGKVLGELAGSSCCHVDWISSVVLLICLLGQVQHTKILSHRPNQKNVNTLPVVPLLRDHLMPKFTHLFKLYEYQWMLMLFFHTFANQHVPFWHNRAQL